ncbi:hypothetical protein Poly41_55890 [Novipirellula artificiosorum]|uniref:Uncharacterized protein n=1 Tax=Novipirellula artificiosorum TaxID=2528016 RepID=A0A5C6DA15_9BACT|nr:hypothetical protein Poly41_55890 [Novipirellula artificiosorum]
MFAFSVVLSELCGCSLILDICKRARLVFTTESTG